MLDSLPIPYLRSFSVCSEACFTWRTNGGAVSPGCRFGISAESTKVGITTSSRRTAAIELEEGIVWFNRAQRLTVELTIASPRIARWNDLELVL